MSLRDPWIGQQNTKLSSDSWKKGSVCSHGFPSRAQQSWELLEHSGNNFLAQVGKKAERGNALMPLIPENLEELVRGVKDEGQPWLETPWQGGVQSPERREQSKKQDHKPGLMRAAFSLWRDLLGRVPQDAVLERKGVQETQFISKDQPLHSSLTSRNQAKAAGDGTRDTKHCMNTNPGVLGWVRAATVHLELGLEQERRQERFLQLHQCLCRTGRDWSTSAVGRAEGAGIAQPGAEQPCQGSY